MTDKLIRFKKKESWCVWSFNYVENHDSTARKELVKAQRDELNKAFLDLRTFKDDQNDLKEKLKQACHLMSEAEINDKGVVCEKEETEETEETEVEEEQAVESEDSDA